MNVYFPDKAIKRLDAKMAFIKGRGAKTLADEIAGRVAEGNDHDRLAGLDRYGRPQAPVKPRRGKYKGASGPPLAPFGAGSRVVTGFRSEARRRGGQWRIIAGWKAVVSSKGVPFLPFHDRGVRHRPGTRSAGKVARVFKTIRAAVTGSWFIPPRPIFGISPRTWAGIRKRIDEFKAKARKIR